MKRVRAPITTSSTYATADTAKRSAAEPADIRREQHAERDVQEEARRQHAIQPARPSVCRICMIQISVTSVMAPQTATSQPMPRRCAK